MFVKSDGVWSQQARLVGTGQSVNANGAFGYAVVVSMDGNTIVASSVYDDTSTGAIWVFTRSGVTWTQSGSKIAGDTASLSLGNTLSMSGDTNTLAIGTRYNVDGGLIYMYEKIGGQYQLITTIAPADVIGGNPAGYNVAMSASGTRLISYLASDDSNTGALWIFHRKSNSQWQQINKIVSPSTQARFGYAADISADGSTICISSQTGYWLNYYSYISGYWKLIRSIQNGNLFGYKLRLSADGRTMAVTGSSYILHVYD